MSALNRLRAAAWPHRDKGLVILASLAVHVAVLSAFAVQRGMDMRGVAAPPAPLFIRIEPRPPMAGERVRETPLVVIEEPREQARRTEADPDANEEEEDAVPLVRVLPAPAAEAARAQGVDPLWQVRPQDDIAGRVARALSAGALNCSPSNTNLTQAQRERCEERLARGAGEAPAISGTADPERDAAFARQGAANIARHDAQRAPLPGGTGVTGPADCVGSNLGTGCAGAHLGDVPGVDMRQGARTPIQQRSNRVRPDR